MARDDDEREYWLRRAAEGGDAYAMTSLAELTTRREQFDEAERWYRLAVGRGSRTARVDLAMLLMQQDRFADAEDAVRPAAEADSLRGMELLAEVLRKLGRTEEAADWEDKHEALVAKERLQPDYALPGIATVATTALVTTAVMPFIQALVSKAAEDAYGQARSLVRRMLRRNELPAAEPEEAAPRLLIADDEDSGVTHFLWSNASDEALRALSSLDTAQLTARRPDQGRVRLVWHPGDGTWHIRGE
jgi:TPR repeat protein